MKAGAIIVAAGRSWRMGGRNKIFAPLRGHPLLFYTLDAFHQCASVEQVVLLVREENLGQGRRLVSEMEFHKVTGVYAGGQLRQDSVMEGLRRLDVCDWVVIHDGARPCVTPGLIARGLQEARESGAAIAAVPVKDTIKQVNSEGIVLKTPERGTLWAAQTPQVFSFSIVSEAYREINNKEFTDDAALVETLGYKVRVYMGSHDNIKVTTPQDLIVAEAILRSRE